MKFSKIVALLLVGLVTAEASFSNLDADPHGVIEARAKKPKAPATPNTPKTPTNPQPPTKPKKPKPTPTPKKTPQPTPSPALKGPFTNHVVYAKKPTDKAGNAKLKKLLAKHVKNPAKDIKELGIKGKHVNYWELPLNAQSAKELGKNKQFAGIARAACKAKCFNPLATLTTQPNAEPELVFFSQKAETQLSQYGGTFTYDDKAGEGVTCYLLDDGADEDIPEFANNKPRFLYPEGITPADHKPGPTGLDHGTCMLSKYVGKDYGIAKKCKPVVVKVPFGANRQVWLNGLTAVKNDVETKKVKKAVLSMSLYWPAQEVDEGWTSSLFENLVELARLNVVLLAASGNNGIGNAGGSKSMDGYPAIMGSSKTPTNRRIPSMIVVGAMKADTGKMWHKSNFDNAKELPHVFAPGEKVKCWKAKPANPAFGHIPQTSDGTSQATASVAGLAAYFMSLPGGPTTPTAVKKKIEDTAWKQGNGGIAGTVDPPLSGMVRVWNEVTVTDLVPATAKRAPRVAVRGIDWRNYEE